MNKKGQVTIFIIIAILVIGAVALFFTLRGSLQTGDVVNPEVVPIQNFVEGCLEDSLADVVYSVGEGGGYYIPSTVSSVSGLEVPYYIKNNQNLMPTKEQIEEDISKYVSRDLVLCLGGFTLFPEYEITKGKMKTKAMINPETVSVEVSYPLYVKKGDFSSKIEDFSADVPVRLGIIYDSISEFIGQELGGEGSCLNCLLDILDQNDLYVASFDFDDHTRIFILRDLNSKINKEEFVYNFANEY